MPFSTATKSKLIAFCNLLLGRFDTQVVVPIPDMNGRKEILTLYLVSVFYLLFRERV